MIKTIKAIHTKRYEVELVQLDNAYYIAHNTSVLNEPKFSENITDYNTASFLFDLKVEELEGQ